MERLTQREEHCPDPKEIYGVSVKDHDYIAAANRLADYEDTGLTPEDINKIQCDWSDLRTIIGECGGLDRVRELARADKEGCVVNYKPGDTVYDCFGMAWTVTTTEMRFINGELHCLYRCGHEGTNHYRALWEYEILTREEAEKALEAMKDG